MYLHELKLWNFRKYGIYGDSFESAEPGLSVRFNKGVNVLVGENDSGKTTIIDAIRYILKTQSLEYYQIDEKDFYQNSKGLRADELRIECTFKGFSDSEAGNFLEWIGFEKNKDGESDFILKLWLYARNKDNSIYQSVRAGIDSEGSYIEGEARDLLRVVYLKPLRDALSEMTHGNKSRLAQILKSHSVFKKGKDEQGKGTEHELETNYIRLKKEVDDFFDPKSNQKGKVITESINTLLSKHFLFDKGRNAIIELTGSDLSDILKQLDLVLETNKSGLGSLNLLCIAAELLLFNETKTGLRLTLIEELEAHLHPQYQLRLIDFINQEENVGQFILTTHSTTLASKIKLENLIICKNTNVYPMGSEFTQLEQSDYKFLQRFLDATKANLFFAKGVIIVEGDAENLLIPTIAKLIDRPLHKYGISIVNVGSTAFKRYAKIFLRKDDSDIGLPVSIISDLDVRSIEYFKDVSIPEFILIDDKVITQFKGISTDIDYTNIPDFFINKSEFENYISTYKTIARFPTGKKIKEMLIDAFDKLPKTVLNDEIIQTIREKKKSKIIAQWGKGAIRIFLPEKWTLEYDIACSGLYKYLDLAILIASIEKNSPSIIIEDCVFENAKTAIEEKYPEAGLTPQQSYDIFKPLSKGSISKASTAQYLAEILESEDKKDPTLKKTLKSDPYLKYLCDAIYHVTEPSKEEQHG